MVILDSIEALTPLQGPLFFAVGVFDGVHLGHQAVLKRAQAEALPLQGTALPVSFDPHPLRFLRPEAAPAQITLTAHKTRLLASLGFSHALILPFNATLATTEASVFVETLAQSARPMAGICVGEDWSFGKERRGNLALLQALGARHGFQAIGVEAVRWKDEVISSTRVRACLAQGDLRASEALLGRPYSVYGTVEKGRQLARSLGFPTANLALANEQLPPLGVYAIRARWNSRILCGVANLGLRPTVESKPVEPRLEVHFFDFDDTLYGASIEIFFGSFLRPEKRFTDLGHLRAQIERDVHIARETLRALPPLPGSFHECDASSKVTRRP